MNGKIEKINIENGYIKISGVLYKFNHPYTTSPSSGSKKMLSGAARMLLKNDGTLRYNEGDDVEFAPATDGELKYIKYIGDPKPESQSGGNYGGYKKKDATLSIYRQHSEKVVGAYVTELIAHMDRPIETVSVEMIDEFVRMVNIGANQMMENYLKAMEKHNE